MAARHAAGAAGGRRGDGDRQLSGDRQPAGAIAISVAGGTGNSTLYLVDGGYNNDPQNNTGNAIPFPDALQEFRTEAGVRDARSGLSAGGTVNAITKSGTNAFHGNVFEFCAITGSTRFATSSARRTAAWDATTG